MKILTFPVIVFLACLAWAPAAGEGEPSERLPDGLATPLPPEISELLDGMRVSTAGLEAVLRFQADLLEYASTHPELARDLRAPMKICLQMLADYWCRSLPGTFR